MIPSYLRRAVALLLAVAFAAIGLAAQRPNAGTPDDVAAGGRGANRRLQVRDLFRAEQFGDVALSPDGQTIVFTRQRPFDWDQTSGLTNRVAHKANHRKDVWVASVADGTARNLTNGAKDGSGFWRPVWSPDGARVAMLSTRGGRAERLWIWDQASAKLTQLSERAVIDNDFAWVDSRHVAARLAQKREPEPTFPGTDESAQMTALRGWHKRWAGLEPAVSILESGVPMDYSRQRDHEIVLLDVRSAASRALIAVTTESWLDAMHVAPDGKHVAFLDRLEYPAPPYRPGGENTRAGALWRFAIANVGGKLVVDTQQRSSPSSTFQWASDGSSFAFIGHGDGSLTSRLVRGALNGTMDTLPIQGFAPQAFLWVDNQRLLVLGEPEQGAAGSGAKKRSEWWLVSPGQSPRNLTANLTAVPSRLAPADADHRTFVSAAGGELWRFDTRSGTWRNLTEGFSPKIASIAWHARDKGHWGQVIVATASNGPVGQSQYYRIESASGSAQEIVRPSGQASLQDYDPGSGAAVFLAAESSGTILTVTRGASRRTIAETNQFLRNIKLGGWRRIDYRSLDGRALTGWILLPPNYEAGKRYPVVTWVYAGTTYGDKPLGGAGGLNDLRELQLYAAHGYAVLYPSMPMPKRIIDGGSSPADPYMELTKGVLPAIDKAIEEGIADPERLGVMGHSFGGYTTYGLISQTTRFKAAVSRAGPSNWLSMHGTFVPEMRGQPQLPTTGWAMTEESQGAMGNPPWKDLGRYLRNSPIFYVERIETPLLIIQGDMDGVVIEQGEEFFTALLRQNKRARFLRYWGEGHVIGTPVNTQHMVYQILSWLDEHLDIARDPTGSPLWEGNHMRSRRGSPSLGVGDFARFDKLALEAWEATVALERRN